MQNRYFNQAIETDDKFFEAYMMMGDLLLKAETVQ